MRYRLAAIVGSIAHGIRSFASAVLSLVGLGGLARFVVPALVVLLLVGAALSARDTATILGDRPEVTQATLPEVAAFDADSGRSIWFQFDAVVDSSSFATPADTGAFFYLARDPAEPGRGLLVRSALNDSLFRQRVLGAEIVEEPDTVTAALEAFGGAPAGLDLDRARYLDETAAGGDREAAFTLSQLREESAGESVLVSGRVVSPGEYAACAVADGCEGEDAAWWYLFADTEGAQSILLRSPHPPTAIPVQLQGLFQRDTFDLAPVLESDWFAQIDTDVPTERALRAGSEPPILVQASWVPAIILGVLGLLLLLSQLVGYPVFGAEAEPAGARTLAAGDRVDVEITGRLGREGSTVSLDRSPGAVERLEVGELALLLWRYGLLPRNQTRREAEERYVAEAAGERDRLLVHERDQSALVVVDRASDAVSVARGRLHRLGGSVPAVHFRQGTSDAFLATRSTDDRDRAAAELLAEAATR